MDELKKACIPEVNCSAIHTIETPANCNTCDACLDNWGSCSPGGVACKRGALDLDPGTPGCEAVTSDPRGQWLHHSSGDSVSLFSFNDEQFQIPMAVSVLAYGQDDPSCVPTFTRSCAYMVQAMQLEIQDFAIPESSWSGGVATLNGPVAGVDDGTGIAVVAPMLFAFDVRQEETQRTALGVASAQLRINLEDSHSASIIVRADSLDFGGYQIKDLFFAGALTSD